MIVPVILPSKCPRFFIISIVPNETKNQRWMYQNWFAYANHLLFITPGPQLMWIHLVQNSTSAKFQKSPNIHLVRIFALSE